MRRPLATWSVARCRVAPGSAEDGSAIVEFLGVALVLLVPVVYLVLVLGRLQAATFAVDGAAREAARAVATAPDTETAAAHAAAAVSLALADQGISAEPRDVLTVACGADCLAPGSTVDVRVAVDVPLPGVPEWLQGAVPLSVPVTASATTVVDTYVERG
jgi:Na+-transporting methylmalonyl-CoA/oxaloacetate decarboxylase gamma subunit